MSLPTEYRPTLLLAKKVETEDFYAQALKVHVL